ncbi:TonB-dependent receptor [uncultured Draconibacterium sp.]|uniref:SusC/RagA family TonB-linked outer membrane protein n=1 Tax=uncultured Draconibacterium sp. TaxID=1573823 RepID=UPI002AA5F59E|nr:TonB-dependent receptor [uncultured Draconibacterium sp.]
MKNKKSIQKALSFLMFCLFFVAVSTSAFAQQKTVSGKVVDDSGEVLPGVTVVVKGTSQGTVTDIDGNFTISNVTSESVLTISFVGMLSQEIVVGDQTTIEVTLKTDAVGLEEVVVVGYGTQKKATLTGSIDQVNSEAFNDKATVSPALALQGQTPGLVVTRTSAQPGKEDLNFTIRGETSVNAYNDKGERVSGSGPLIVIDGVPAISDQAFLNMNSDDIESVSVLKDGAASIYGARAANGVILVTTKKGSGAMKVNITSNVSVQTLGISPVIPSMADYGTVWLEAAAQDGDYPRYWGWGTEENLIDFSNNVARYYSTVYWGDVYLMNAPRYDDMYGSSISNKQNLSISGATEKTTYRFSAGYAENRGMLKSAYDGVKQYNARFNYDYKVTDWFKIESGFSYLNTVQNNPSTGFGSWSVDQDPSIFPTKNPDGQWVGNFGQAAGNKNTVAASADGGKENIVRDQIRLNIAGTINLTKDLSIRGTASFEKEFVDNDKYVLTVLTYDWEGDQAKNPINKKSSMASTNITNTYKTFGGFVDYNKEIGDHSFSAMAGVTGELKEYSRLYGYREGLDDYGVYDLQVASQEISEQNEGKAYHWGLYSYLGRVNYSYKDKYLFESTFRRDGSSKMSAENQWANFAYVSLGWVLTEESFMENVDLISFMKLRASYGETGNQQGIGTYSDISGMGFSAPVFGTTNAASQDGAYVNGITTTTATWERVENTTIGVDFRLLDNKLFGSFDYFWKKNDGMLINVTYPDVLGATAPKTNSGVLETHGWEAVLGYKGQAGDFKYNVSFNMADSRNELVSMEGVNTYKAGLNRRVQGFPLNSYFLYQTDGFFADQDEVDEYYSKYDGPGSIIPDYDNGTLVLRPGDTKKIDLDDDGAITSSGTISEMDGDVKYMGDKQVHYNFGTNISLQYKKWDMSAFFQGVLDQNIVREGKMQHPFYLVWSNQTNAYIGKTWTPENPDAAYPRMTAYHPRARWNWEKTDFMMHNNRYVRLKSLVLGYSFEDITVRDLNIDKLRIYFSGNDLFEFTSIKDGYDPEFGDSSSSSYPFSRSWSLGVNLTF